MLHRARRVSAIVLLLVAVALTPVLLDVCAVACQMGHGTATAAGAPQCHHDLAARPAIGPRAGFCDHDRDGTTAIASFELERRSLISVLPSIEASDLDRRFSTHGFIVEPVPGPDRGPQRLLIALRI